jgi:hypothetical protein
MRVSTWVGIACVLVACHTTRTVDAPNDDAESTRDADEGGAGAVAAAMDAATPNGDPPPRAGQAGATAPALAGAGFAAADCFDSARVRFFCKELSYANPPEHTPPLALPEAVPFLRASELGQDVRFTDVGGYAVLAERGSGSDTEQFVVRFTPLWSPERVATTVLPIVQDDATQGYSAIDVVGALGSVLHTGSDTIALVCRDGACALFGADSSGDGAMTALPGGTVPQGLTARGLSHFPYDRVCVYGDGGYACFDGRSWGERQLPDTNLHMLQTRGGWLLASGERGALFRGYDAERPLERVETGSSETLVWAAASRACWSATTESGRLLDGCVGVERLLCDGDPLPQAFEYGVDPGPRYAQFVDANGTPYQRWPRSLTQGATWCAMPRLPGAPVIGTSHAVCGLSDNWLLLTADALYVAGFDAPFCAVG